MFFLQETAQLLGVLNISPESVERILPFGNKSAVTVIPWKYKVSKYY